MRTNKILLMALIFCSFANLLVLCFGRKATRSDSTLSAEFIPNPITNTFQGLADLKVAEDYTGEVDFKRMRTLYKGYAEGGKISGLWQKFNALGNLESYVMFLNNESFVSMSFYPDSRVQSILGGKYKFEKYYAGAKMYNDNNTQTIYPFTNGLMATFDYEQVHFYNELGSPVLKDIEAIAVPSYSSDFNLGLEFELGEDKYSLCTMQNTFIDDDSIKINMNIYIANRATNIVESKIFIKGYIDKSSGKLSQSTMKEGQDKFSGFLEKAGEKISCKVLDKETQTQVYNFDWRFGELK